ncbi:YybH family protein [Gemmatimonadota bacterium]
MNQPDQAVFDFINRLFMDAFAKGDFEGVAATYTEDARIMPPGLPTVRGREAIGQFWAGGAEAFGIKSVTLTTVELEVQGKTAHELGEWEIFGAGGPMDRGSYVVIWKQGQDGAWRWHWDIWNSDGAPQG